MQLWRNDICITGALLALLGAALIPSGCAQPAPKPMIAPAPVGSADSAHRAQMYAQSLLIGTLRLDEVTILLQNNQMIIHDRASLAGPQAYKPLLIGRILKLDSPADNGKAMTGLVLFTDGNAWNELGARNSLDSVFCTSGTVDGTITAVGNNTIAVTARTGPNRVIPLANVRLVRSPRAFIFKLAKSAGADGLNNSSLTFSPTAYQSSLGATSVVDKPPGSEDDEDLTMTDAMKELRQGTFEQLRHKQDTVKPFPNWP